MKLLADKLILLDVFTFYQLDYKQMQDTRLVNRY